MLHLIDSHCHLHDREFFTAEQAEEMLERARKRGVTKIVCIGTDPEDSMATREFASCHDGVYWTYGVHPENCSGAKMSEMAPLGPRPAGPSPWAAGATPRAAALRIPSSEPFSDIAAPKRPVAIGEVGLDYHYEGYDRDAQIELFEEMLQLAVDNELPVSFHIREAFEDFFPVVANFPRVRGVVHSFTDSKKVLRRILNETEFYVGVNGLATYSTLPTPPLERTLLETDAPFLAPVPYRGNTNEPAYVAEVAKWLATKMELDEKEIIETTTQNCHDLFGI